MAERVLAAVLAAGQARRFGGGKLDAPCAGRRLGGWALRAVEQVGPEQAGVEAVIIVPSQVPRFAAESGWPLIVNRAAERGLGTSLACAAQTAAGRGATHLLVLLADMPLVDAALLKRLLASPAPAAVEHGLGRPGVPALLPACTFGKLTQLDGDRGAAALLQAMPDLCLVAASPGALLDVDDVEALQRAASMLQDHH